MYSSPSIMFFIFFLANLAQKFKKSMLFFFSLFLYCLSNKTHKIIQIYKHKDMPIDLQNTKTFINYSVILSHSHYEHKDLQGFKIPSINPKSLHTLIQIYKPKQTQIAKTPNSRSLSTSSPTPTSTSPLSSSSYSKMPLPKTSTMCMSTPILPPTSPTLKALSSNSTSFQPKKPTAAR